MEELIGSAWAVTYRGILTDSYAKESSFSGTRQLNVHRLAVGGVLGSQLVVSLDLNDDRMIPVIPGNETTRMSALLVDSSIEVDTRS